MKFINASNYNLSVTATFICFYFASSSPTICDGGDAEAITAAVKAVSSGKLEAVIVAGTIGVLVCGGYYRRKIG